MQRILFLLTLVFVLFSSITFAQLSQKIDLRLSHPLSKTNSISYKKTQFTPDTIRVVAILVQFQQDSDPRSTGDGRFDLSNKYYDPVLQKDTVIDAPPYDSSYFADHLLFLKNYYYKSSKGKLIITYELYGKVITLPNQMQHYSPQRNENLLKLGELYNDAWAAADSFINFSGYDSLKTAFLIFHAGTGRDIDLTSIYGYDPFPFDIPSLYIGLNTLKNIYGSNYEGYTTSEGFRIKNSLIVPSTELRELDLISGKYLLQLGINGILCATFGSYLGLPDLFNTQTGKTAIGRFGLMDGQSIFSFNGIFPPEPSAWEKTFLGWINPIVVSSGDSYYRLQTSSVPFSQDSTMFKVLINSREYFLLENRNRMPDAISQVLYLRNHGKIDSLVVTKDTIGFVNYDIHSVNGNVVDVKYLDWSLPGDISDTGYYAGGILIWHIDENVIEANFASNTINNNIEHKGVDLEEAKGSQDIGVTYSTPFGDFTGDGLFVDFWYNGNHYVPSTIYKNAFTPESYPNSLSYSIANTNIYITEFDTISAVMKFRISIGGPYLTPLAGFPKYIGGIVTDFTQPLGIDINGDGKDEIIINNGTDVFAFKYNGNNFLDSNSNGILLRNFGYLPISQGFSQYFNTFRWLIASKYSAGSTTIGLFRFNNISTTDSVLFNVNFTPTAPLLVFDSNKVVLGLSANYSNKIYEIGLASSFAGIVDSTNNPIYYFSKLDNINYRFSSADSTYFMIGNLTGANSKDSVFITRQGVIRINDKIINTPYSFSKINSNPILVDINKDLKQEIVFVADNKLYAITSAGILLENFPVNFNKKITSGLICGDINGDGIYDILFVTSEGDLYAYGSNGSVVRGFPIKVGINTTTVPAFVNLNDTLGIVVYSGDRYLYAFKSSFRYDENKLLWKGFLKDKYYSNNNFFGTFSQPLFNEKLPANKVYNWPNPVYDNKTYIRYYINGTASSVKIKILDLSGELVTELQGTTYSNTDNEIPFDVTKVQSGIYYGVIEAIIDGTKETRIIKIAIVK